MLAPAVGSDTTGAAADAETFASLINKCGGIGGRRFELHVVVETGNPLADCLAAVTRFHPLVVVTTAASAAQQCIVHDQRTIMVTESDVSNADFGASSGRLAATGSSEGVQRARLLDLVDSGRLEGRAVAVVADPIGAEFQRTARSVLATKRIRLVDLTRASAVLEPTLDAATFPLLISATAAARHRQPLDVYGFSSATTGALQQLRQLGAGSQARLLRSLNAYAFAPVTDPLYRADQSPNTFSEMCNQAIAVAVAKAPSSSTTTLSASAPLSPTYLTIADVCLVIRIAARGLFAAGPVLDPTALVGALHRLPYIDEAAPGGTPKPRPNQIVNEPVTRIAQVIVLTQLQSRCPSAAPAATAVGGLACWTPVSGWDDGGRVVNVPLRVTADGLTR
jgi:hypothetical protein